MEISGNDDTLRISRYAVTDCLGPGKRFAVWVQGCKKNCKGCIAEPLRDPNGGTLIKVNDLIGEFFSSGADGITISGGEPFLQARQLSAFLERIRGERPDTGVMIYTGFLYEELLSDTDCASLISLADLLIDGEYLEELDDGKPMRGSSNQRLIFLTDRYAPSDMPLFRKNKAVFSDGEFYVIGIPSDGAKTMIDIFRE